ncbi:precorrin-3B synthase [Methylobacterium sp. NEAU K]|uniref:precorrin-3B synthase n=1 Tax=Methylobacterium sp. NEAU K TaxID=3064946 RepID=UPI002733503D|nr:precorrin-3B synthase [Methylobacterium sp. NEAU K]MDP4002411.1 precorrin-3B synthase [Methylobacterium sp. NEAU K]
MSGSAHRRPLPAAPARRGWCPGLARPMPTGDGLLARVHPPLGILTLQQARAVAEGARRFGNGHLDLTARANIQIRGVSEATRTALAHLLTGAGLGDVRADGGPQRLTLTSPLAGRDPAETIDVPGLARAIEAAGLGVPGLPPKTLVAVEGRPGAALPEADCLVFSRAEGGVGLAVATERGSCELVACAEQDAPAVMAALLTAFVRTGRRRMRDVSAAELRALAEVLPPDVLARVHSDARERRRSGISQGALPFSPPAGLGRIAPSFWMLALEAPFGRCTADALDRLADYASRLSAREIRLSPARGFVLLLPPDAPVARLADLSENFIVAPDDPRRGVAACTGAPACASGSTPTLADAARLAEVFRPLAARGRSAHVSGCAKGCARPGPADVTLVGRDGLYGAVIGGAPGDEPAIHLPIEAVLERIGRADTVGLAAAFAPDCTITEGGRNRRPT